MANYYSHGKRHYYAAYSPYGVDVAYGMYNPGTVFIFDSREARTAFVDTNNAPDPYNRHYEAITACEARRIAPDREYYHAMPDGSLVNLDGYVWTDDGPVWEG